MSKLGTVLRVYREKNIRDFMRFLLFKQHEYRHAGLDRIRSWYNRQLIQAQVTEVGSGLKIGPRENVINRGEGGKIIIGNDVTIHSPIEITAATHIFPESYVEIGDRTRIGSYTGIRCAREIIIGKDCLISSYVRIYDYNGHPLAPYDSMDQTKKRNRMQVPSEEVRTVKIGDNVWLGENVFIQAGVTIGSNSIISANSVVIKNVPENVIAFGSPARVIGWLNK